MSALEQEMLERIAKLDDATWAIVDSHVLITSIRLLGDFTPPSRG